MMPPTLAFAEFGVEVLVSGVVGGGVGIVGAEVMDAGRVVLVDAMLLVDDGVLVDFGKVEDREEVVDVVEAAAVVVGNKMIRHRSIATRDI
jgi:hypothetical protein